MDAAYVRLCFENKGGRWSQQCAFISGAKRTDFRCCFSCLRVTWRRWHSGSRWLVCWQPARHNPNLAAPPTGPAAAVHMLPSRTARWHYPMWCIQMLFIVHENKSVECGFIWEIQWIFNVSCAQRWVRGSGAFLPTVKNSVNVTESLLMKLWIQNIGFILADKGDPAHFMALKGHG